METLNHFLFNVCGVTAGWKMEDVLDQEIKTINDMVRPEDHVICALSGGVDSTVAATLVHKAIGDRLHCIFVDNGLLRFEFATFLCIHESKLIYSYLIFEKSCNLFSFYFGDSYSYLN